MKWPQAADYAEAVQNLDVAFRDPDIRAGQTVTNAMGLPVAHTGNFAAVFEVRGASGAKSWAAKCFTRHVPGLEDRYHHIDAHLRQHWLPFMVGFRYLPESVLVRGQWYAFLKMDWVDGLRLDEFLSETMTQRGYKSTLRRLCDMWVRMARMLREAQVGHGDLQHGNVLLVPDREKQGAYNLRLIDYDGMYVPSLEGDPPGEVGHPAYQHPQRLARGGYGPEIDRFSHLLIYTTLRCLIVGGRELWDRYYDQDRLLLGHEDLEAPRKSALFKQLWALPDEPVRHLVGHLILAASGPGQDVPLLDDVVLDFNVVGLTRAQQRQVDELLSPGVPSAPESQPTAVARESSPSELPVVTCLCGQSFRPAPHLLGQQMPCPVCDLPIDIPGAETVGSELSPWEDLTDTDDLWEAEFPPPKPLPAAPIPQASAWSESLLRLSHAVDALRGKGMLALAVAAPLVVIVSALVLLPFVLRKSPLVADGDVVASPHVGETDPVGPTTSERPADDSSSTDSALDESAEERPSDGQSTVPEDRPVTAAEPSEASSESGQFAAGNPFTDAAAVTVPPDVPAPNSSAGARARLGSEPDDGPFSSQEAASHWQSTSPFSEDGNAEYEDTSIAATGVGTDAGPANDAEMSEADALIAEAQRLIAAGNAEMAKEKLLDARRENPADMRADFYLGLLEALLNGKPKTARRYFTFCAKQAPTSPACLNNLAIVELRLKDIGEAARLWSKAARVQPVADEVVHNVGLLLQLADQRWIRLLPAQRSSLMDHLSESGVTAQVSHSGDLWYMDYPGENSLSSNWAWPDLIDRTCLLCDGTGTLACPNKHCRRGRVRVPVTKVVGMIPGTRNPITKTVQVPIVCTTCGGNGRVTCPRCRGVVDGFQPGTRLNRPGRR